MPDRDPLPPHVTMPLLDVVIRNSLDVDYQHVAEMRAAAGESESPVRRWRAAVIVGVMTDHWDSYVAVWANNFLPGSADDAVMWIGVVTLAIGVLVAVAPHFGGDVLGIWLVLLAINLFGVDGVAHLAVGMLALAFCSFAMARMVRGDHVREA